MDHDIDHLCTSKPPDNGHEHRLRQQCMTLTSSSVVAPPTANQKAEEKRRINEMKEQAKKRKAPRSGSHLILKIPNGNRRSRAKRLQAAVSVQGNTCEGCTSVT